MELRKYSETQDGKLRLAYTAYSKGNLEAGRFVDRDVRAYMEREGKTDYSEALRERSRELQKSEHSYVSDQLPQPQPKQAKVEAAGAELDAVAKDLMLAKKIGYTEALRLACLSNPKTATKYIGRAVRGGGFREVYGEHEKVKNYAMSPVVTLANLVQGVPKRDDHQLDLPIVLAVLAGFGDLVAEAAQEQIVDMARAWIHQQGLPGNDESHMEQAEQEVRREHRDLARMADGGEATERGLRDLYPQYFIN